MPLQPPDYAELIGGRYRPIAEIGQGAMGRVIKAQDTHVNDVLVAVKILDWQAQADDAEQRARFRAEMEAMATLRQERHPNIVPILDYSEREAQPYLVMDYIAGGTLRDRLARRMPGLAIRYQVLTDVANALSYMHDRRLVHRDLKPSNILIDAPDVNTWGAALVSDLGIAWPAGRRPGRDSGGVGTAGYVAPEQWAGEAIDHRADIYSLGVIAWQLFTGETPPFSFEARPDLLPARLEQTLRQALAPRPEDRYPSAAEFLQALLQAPAPPVTPPFKGLAYFDRDDAHLFFGREELIAELAGRLGDERFQHRRFLAVLGASGSGKSSVVRAGLIPALERGQPPKDGARLPEGSSDWIITIVRPTAHPLASLATALAERLAGPDSLERARPEGREAGGVPPVEQWLQEATCLHRAACALIEGSAAGRVLIVVDQLEELFTLCHDEAERRAFLDNLFAAVSEPGGPAAALVTLQSEFYPLCDKYDHLRQALADQQVYIGPMKTLELRAAIEGPARLNNWQLEIEPGLVDLILRDAGQEPGALPLLSHALREVWNQRRGRVLTLDGYIRSGGVRGAIARTADSVFEQLSPRQQAIARRLFVELTEVGEDMPSRAGRRAARQELLSGPEGNLEIEAVLRKLVEARLITIDQDAVEVAHAALIREWPRLQQWLAEDREIERIRRRINREAQEWQRVGRDPGALYRGARLAEAAEWAGLHRDRLSELGREFLAASSAEAERVEREQEAARQRELRAAQKLAEAQKQRAEEQSRFAAQLRQRALWLAAALSVAIVMAIVASLLGAQATRTADSNASLASTAQADANARATAEANAIAESHVRATAQAGANTQRQIAFARFLASQAGIARAAPGSTGELAVLLSVESLLRYPSLEGSLALQRALAALVPQILYIPPDAGTHGFYGRDFWGALRVLSPDGRWVLTNREDGQGVLVWDVAAGIKAAELAQSDVPILATFSPDGRWVLTAGGNTVYAWAVPTWRETARLRHDSPVSSIAFSSDGRWMAPLSLDQAVRVWETATWSNPVQLEHAGPADMAAISPDGQFVATLSERKIIRVWYVPAAQVVLELKQEEPVSTLTFSPDGKWIVAGSGRFVRRWEVVTGLESDEPLEHRAAVNFAAFSADGQWLVTSTQDDAVQAWKVRSSEVAARFLPAGIQLDVVSPAPDGRWIATVSTYAREDEPGLRRTFVNGRVQLWEMETGQELVTFDVGGRDLAFSSGGDWFAAETGSGQVRVWKLPKGGELAQLYHGDFVSSAAFDPRGQWIATASDDATTRVWDAAAGQELARVLHTQRFGEIAGVSQDGQRLIVVGGCGNQNWPCASVVGVWDWKNGREVLLKHSKGVNLATFNPSGRLVLTIEHNCFSYLAQTCSSTVRTWDATSGRQVSEFVSKDMVRSVTFVDDARIVVAGPDRPARVWDLNTGQEATPTPWPRDEATSAFSNGRWIVTCDAGPLAQVWEIGSGQKVGQFQPAGKLTGLVFSPGQDWAAALGEEAVQVLATTTWQPAFRIEGMGPIPSAYFSPNGRWLLLPIGGVVRVWDTATGLEVAQLQHPSSVRLVALSGDSRWAATVTASASEPNQPVPGTAGSTVHLWEVGAWQEVARLEHRQRVRSALFSPDGHTLATIAGNAVRLWHWQYADLIALACARLSRNLTPQEWRQYFDEPYRKSCPNLPADGQLSASVSPPLTTSVAPGPTPSERFIHIRPISPSVPPASAFVTITQDTAARLHLAQVLEGHTSRVSDLAFSPDGAFLASSSADNTVRLWRVSDGAFLGDLTGHGGDAQSVAFSPDGKELASGSSDGQLRLWGLADSTLEVLPGYRALAWRVRFSPDGRWLAASFSDKTIRLWSVRERSVVHTLRVPAGAVPSIAFSPDSTQLAAAAPDRTVQLWRTSDGVLAGVLKGHTDYIWSVAFSPDGTLLAAGAQDGTIRLWPIGAGEPRVWGGQGGAAYGLAFSPDGTVLASAHHDGQLRLWRVSDGALLQTLEGHTAALSALAFSPDGQTLASAAEDGALRLWRVGPR